MPTTGIVRPRGDMLRPWAMADWPYPSVGDSMTQFFEVICLLGLWCLIMSRLEKYGLTVYNSDFWVIILMVYGTAGLNHAIAG